MGDSCCSVGARPDASEIDAALLEGGHENSYRKIAGRHGLSVGALQRHKPHISDAYQETDTAPDTPADAHADGAESAANTPDTGRISEPALPTPLRSVLAVPNPGDDPMTAPRKIVTADVELRCVQLRVKGKSYEEIADEVGIHWETAMDAVERVLLRTRGKADSLADKAREIELRRCDAIIASFWDRATNPEMAVVDVPADTESGVRAYDGQDKAADRLLKAMERRAKLLGLDAPSAAVTVNILSAPDAAPVVRALSQLVYALCPAEAATLDAFLADVDQDRDGAKTDALGWLERRRATITVEAG